MSFGVFRLEELILSLRVLNGGIFGGDTVFAEMSIYSHRL